MKNDAFVELCVSLPALGALTQKVAGVHGPQDPRLYQVLETFAGAAKDLNALALGATDITAGDVAKKLEHLGELTDGFIPPPHACGSYRTLLERLDQLGEEALPLLQHS